jgi:1-phosphofructokinase/tagatose 6-phosphate kinase
MLKVGMKQASLLSVCMNPTLQKTLVFPGFIPDRVNRTGEYRLDASGKGINVSRVLTQLGKSCVHLTQLGGVLRDLFLDLCGRDNLELQWVESFSPIRFCYTLINKGEGTVTELVEESEAVGEGTEDRLLAAYARLLPGISTVIISGAKAAGFSDLLVGEMVRLAKARSATVILDVRGQDLLQSLPWGPDIIKPNLYEFAATFAPELVDRNEIAGEEGAVKERIREIWKDLYRRYHSRLVLTRGAKTVWYSEGEKLEEFSFEPDAKPLNSTGSGDAFTAGLAAALDGNAALGGADSLRNAIAEGCRCGALNAALLRPGVIRAG